MTPILAPAANTIWFGAAPKDHMSELDDFVTAAGQTPALFQYYNAWANANVQLPFDAVKATYLRNYVPPAPMAQIVTPMAPIVTWEPWDTSIDSVEQLPYKLSTISNGDWDQYIVPWAMAVRSWGQPLFLRFAHEMNGNWYPWGTANTPVSTGTGLPPNGNTPQDYVDAWRHVHDKFRCLDVTNVTWIWAPNIWYSGSTHLRDVYPGEDYVDWIGIDGYNFGDDPPDHTWETVDQVFEETLRRLEFIGKPLMITETACEEVSDPLSKAAWIDDFFAMLNRGKTFIRGFVWFNEGPPEKIHNWPIQSSVEATTAFSTNIAALASAGALAPAPV
jgi:beta-mannanase